MKKLFPFLFCICLSQNTYDGTINFNYSGTVSNAFTSLVQDTIVSGVAFNQVSDDTSYFIFGSVTQQGENQYDLFFSVLRDTIFPVQPRIWEIPGNGNEDNPLSFETILIFLPGLDSSFVIELFENFSDTSASLDSLNLDSLLLNVFLELTNDLYLGLSGELEIFNVTDSTIQGSFYSTLIKPAFNIPPHIIVINDGQFQFNKTNSPNLNSESEKLIIVDQLELLPAYPNPFNPATILSFHSDYNIKTHISLYIYDLNGRKIETLINHSITPGHHTIQWDASNKPSGVYIAKLQSEFSIQTTKLILIK